MRYHEGGYGEDARFKKSFERIVLGVIGRETYLMFARRSGDGRWTGKVKV